MISTKKTNTKSIEEEIILKQKEINQLEQNQTLTSQTLELANYLQIDEPGFTDGLSAEIARFNATIEQAQLRVNQLERKKEEAKELQTNYTKSLIVPQYIPSSMMKLQLIKLWAKW